MACSYCLDLQEELEIIKQGTNSVLVLITGDGDFFKVDKIFKGKQVFDVLIKQTKL